MFHDVMVKYLALCMSPGVSPYGSGGFASVRQRVRVHERGQGESGVVQRGAGVVLAVGRCLDERCRDSQPIKRFETICMQ